MDSALALISERVRDAAARGTALRIVGGGTKAFHPASRARAPAEELDLRALAGVLSYEPSELVITVRAGTPLAEVEQLLAEQGQALAFEPPRFAAGGTVGGMVAAGLSGPARANAGAVRDFVLGVEIVNGRGELLRYGGQVMKNVAGYDVSRLMAGSWGRLAVLTEVSLKVLPVAPTEATLRFEGTQAESLARLHAWGGQPLPLNASCWVEEGGAGRLYVRLRGARAAVGAACRRMGGELQDAGLAAQDWQACRDQHLPWFADRAPGMSLWRLSVPQTAPVLALPAGVAPPLVEWHGGQRWVWVEPGHGSALQALAQSVGGHAELFRPAAGGVLEAAPPAREPALQAIEQRLEAAFDPAGIFRAGAAGE